MALDLYLVVVTANGTQLVGNGAPKNLKNPFRADVAVSRPLVVSDFSFGGVATPTAGGAGKVDLAELTVTLPDDSVTPTLFAALCIGTRLTTADVLAVDTTNGTRVVSGVGLAPVVVTGLTRTVTADGVRLTLAFDAQKYSVGSAPHRPDGTFATFTFVTYNPSTGQVT